MGHLTVILGCMFAQKTTELVRMIRRYRSVGWRVLVVNHSTDIRYGKECISSHDSEQESAWMVGQLAEVDQLVRSGEYQAVAVDEGQFFPDLFEYVTAWADQCPVNVVVAGLDGTSQREPFGDMLRLVPHAEEVMRLSALCSRCRDGTKAIYSRRILEGTGSTTILVGATESYEPVCRKHFLE
jgi:thymidine kinase